MILSKSDPMDVDLRLYREAVLAGFFPSKEDLTNESLADFLGNKRIILAGETAGPGRGWWGPPIGTHGTGDVGGGGGTLETTVITGRSADARDEIWDELNETWAGGPRRNMARNASEKYGNQLLVMRDEKGIAAIAGISGRPMALDESTMGFHELEHLATRESGLGRQAMAGVSAHISDIGGSGYYLHATLSAEGFYRRLGLTEVEGYSRAFKVTAGEAQKPSIVDDEPEDGVFVDKDSETDELGEAGPGRGWWGPPVGTHGTGSPGDGTGGTSPGVINEDYQPPRLNEALVGDLDALGKWEVHSAAEEMGHGATMRAYSKVNNRWTQGAEQEAKVEIHGWLRDNPTVRTFSLYEDWSNSKGDQSFGKWLDTPEVFWRGGGKSYPFMSFTRSKSAARDASGGEQVWWVKMKPSQLLGSGMTGAGEVYISTRAIASVGELSEAGPGWHGEG